MQFRLGALAALPILALLLLPGCDNTPPYSGPGLPTGYKKFEREPNPVVELTTDAGKIKIELFEDRTPDTVDNFVELVEAEKYDGLTFHRIVKDFMIQGGDPKGDGSGGPGYKFHDENIHDDSNKNDQYSVAMANSGPNTNGSQFFIVTAAKGAHYLDQKHTVFGKVIEGKDVVDKLNQTPVTGEKPNTPPKIVSALVVSKRKREYKLAENLKVKDAPPQSITLPQGTFTPDDIKRMQQQGAKPQVTFSQGAEPPKTPDKPGEQPKKAEDKPNVPPTPPAKTSDQPKTPDKPADPVKPPETKKPEPATPPQK